MEFKYKTHNNSKTRMTLSHHILLKNPDKIPIILEKDISCTITPIKKTKFLIGKNMTVNQFQRMIRILLKIGEEEALFLSAKGKYTIAGQKSLESIYNTYKDEDGYLYIAYSTELIYG